MIKYYFSYTVPLFLVFCNVKVTILGTMRIRDIFKMLVLDLKMFTLETRKSRVIVTVNEYLIKLIRNWTIAKNIFKDDYKLPTFVF